MKSGGVNQIEKQVKCSTCYRSPKMKYTVMVVGKRKCSVCLHVCKHCFSPREDCMCIEPREAYIRNMEKIYLLRGGTEPKNRELALSLSSIIGRARKHFLQETYFSPHECKKIKTFCEKVRSPFEMIKFGWSDDNFNYEEQDTRRHQKLIFRYDVSKGVFPAGTPESLMEFINTIKTLHPATKTVVVKLLRSKCGCKRQLNHVDDNDFIRGNHPPSDMSLNIIVPLEPAENPTPFFVTNQNNIEQTMTLPQGSVFCFTSDCIHAGAEHKSRKYNFRLHFSIGTATYPNDGNTVGIRDDITKYDLVKTPLN